MQTFEKELQLHHMKKTPYFEGWYLRVLDPHISIAVIIGIAKEHNKQEVFIQVFHTLTGVMEKVSYDLSVLSYQSSPFEVKIKDSVFKKESIYIKDKHLSILLDLKIAPPKYLNKTYYAPTIMGPFAYLENMQCNHAITNLGSHVTGEFIYDHKTYLIDGQVYQEKDWGSSFPTQYIWGKSLSCLEKKASLFLSCATIPLKIIHFTGIIMHLTIEEKRYTLATYYGAHIVKREKLERGYRLDIKQGKYLIECLLEMGPIYTLEAPHEGEMIREVEESLLGKMRVKLYLHQQCIETLTFENCGLEHDQFFI